MPNPWIEIIGMPVFSKKNSKVIAGKKLLSSERVRDYEHFMIPLYNIKKKYWCEQFEHEQKPVTVEFYFIRPTKAKFDWVNIAQLPLDMMQAAGWIKDDDCYTVNPVFVGWEINPDASKCGVRIRVRKTEEEETKHEETQNINSN